MESHAGKMLSLLECVMFHIKQNSIALPGDLMADIEHELSPPDYQNPFPNKIDNRKRERLIEINPEQLLLQDEALLTGIAHVIRARNHILCNDDTNDKERDALVIGAKDILLLRYLIKCIKDNADVYLELLAEGCAINFSCDACSPSYQGVCPKMNEQQVQRTLRVHAILKDIGVFRPSDGDREIRR